ncbi:MAG TPA: hypothetical protein VKG25_09310 [Bryobacteraceae bacterium]|nr:hypothetical protein [Bryobacteraceae bacterium]
MSAQESWRLNEAEAEFVAARYFRTESVVSVLSILCNWGPPVSGRFDSDFLDIWVAADDSLSPKSVVLYGCTDAWHDIGEFVKSKTTNVHGKAVGLYRFSGWPVEEFVVRLTDHRGDPRYDNNGGYGVNYRLRRYGGLQLNCVRAAVQNWILVFPKLVEIRGTAGVADVSFGR